MAAISSLGVGSGLDIKGLVSSLIEAEGAAKSARYDRRETEYQAKLSMYSTMKSALSDFQGTFSQLKLTSSFSKVFASSSNDTMFTATASRSADVSSYDIEIDAIAAAQKLQTDVAPPGISDKTLSMGTGTLTFEFQGDIDNATGISHTVDINEGSLLDIRDSINDKNIGVTANVLYDGSAYQLVITSKTGEEGNLSITASSTTGDLSAFASANLKETQASSNALLTIDGVSITSQTNNISNIIENVTLDLKSAGTTTEKLTIEKDDSGVKEAVQGFVDGFNGLMETLNTASFYNEETGNSGILIGDATVRGIVSQVRNVLNTSASNDPFSKYNSFASLGILTARDGTLEFDSDKFNAALETEPDAVKHLLAGGKSSSTNNDINILSITDNIGAGSYNVEVGQQPKQGSWTGNNFAASNLNFSTGGPFDFKIAVDGVNSNSISINKNYFDDGAGGSLSSENALSAFSADLQNLINADSNLVASGKSVTVNPSFFSGTNNGQLNIVSSVYGVSSAVAIVEDFTEVSMQASIAGIPGVDGTATIGGQEATLNGNILTGSGIFAGFQLEINGGAAGTGSDSLFTSITVKEGKMSQLSRLIDSFLESDGLLDSKTDGLNASINDINAQRQKLEERLTLIEARYIKQFSAMDSLVAQLNTTSSFLQNQLASLPGARQN